MVHPEARPGAFQAELWRYDVAEFFLHDPACGHYLEINLAPNGAWWSCLFRAPREPREDGLVPLPGVQAGAVGDGRGWDAHLSLPLEELRARIPFGPGSRLHAAFLLDRPQRCLTSAPPVAGDPDFHHPGLPGPVQFC